jgi:hypothetical protein
MDKRKQDTGLDFIEGSMDLAVWIAFMVTIISVITLTSTGTVSLLAAPDWFDLLFFVGAGFGLALHYIIRMLMVK